VSKEQEPQSEPKKEEVIEVSFEEGTVVNRRMICPSCGLWKHISQFRFDGDDCVDCRGD